MLDPTGEGLAFACSYEPPLTRVKVPSLGYLAVPPTLAGQSLEGALPVIPARAV
ncbi:hypothetical protein [Nitrosococcus oceani]|uniref:hypothetical protein n=1 Tax=Nitrosococcus oceani TaxID=1229 RepID=UPI0012DF5F5B|nr:hypothetical protein [Nitrosococcus oceani]